MIAFILFAATVKFTKLLRFNKRILTLAVSMVGIMKPLASFSLVFGEFHPKILVVLSEATSINF